MAGAEQGLEAAASAMWADVGETHRHLITSLATKIHLHLCSVTSQSLFLQSLALTFAFSYFHHLHTKYSRETSANRNGRANPPAAQDPRGQSVPQPSKPAALL